jgi:uncharacterized protein YoxC
LENLLTIAKIIAAVSVSALCIYTIVFMVRLKETIMDLGQDVKHLNEKFVPVMENLEVITRKLRNITENLSDEIGVVKSSAEAIRDMTQSVVSLERKIQQEIEGPILDAVGFLAAVVKGVRTFFYYLRRPEA